MRYLPVLVGAFFLVGCFAPEPSVLVFTKTNGFRHAAIESGQEALRRLAGERGYQVEFTEDSTAITEEALSGHDAVIFLLTTGDVLDAESQLAMERFIQAGGGYVGVHSASDTEYDWPWYGRLVGAYFTGHPAGTPEGRITVTDTVFQATAHLPPTWHKNDEWYDQRTVNQFVNVVLTVDESSYMQDQRRFLNTAKPVSWYHEFDGGRSFYTALGHAAASFEDPLFVQHLAGGLEYAIGVPGTLNYGAETVRPREDQFQLTVLADTLNEPMELDVLPDGRLIFVERRGEVHLVDPANGSDTVIAEIPVHYALEDGLLGMALDPNVAENGWIYLYFSPPGDQPLNRLSRFHFDGAALDLGSESVVLDVPTQRDECCHSGGSVEFGPDGTLYLSIGDNTNPFASDGFAPTDGRPGRAPWDARRTSANSADLRGKILRVMPEPGGGYSIPAGNLFPPDGSRGRPEIFTMGNRNPFRINVDQRNGWLYWGEIGPDAAADDPDRGPRGYDEINQARGPGFFGWPLFIADNRPYAEFDFGTEVAGEFAVGASPVNESPGNTGRAFLPPAQGAFIWYPYKASDEFPVLGEGGRSAMAGPIYYAADHSEGPGHFPEYYSGRLFVHEWMRNKIYLVDIDRYGWYGHMENFLEGTTFSRPVDLGFGPNGDLYVLEYGTKWNQENPDARVVRIAFEG